MSENSMDAATAPQLRRSLVMADRLVKAGIMFVPMPCIDKEDFESRVAEMQNRLEEIAVGLEGK